MNDSKLILCQYCSELINPLRLDHHQKTCKEHVERRKTTESRGRTRYYLHRASPNRSYGVEV